MASMSSATRSTQSCSMPLPWSPLGQLQFDEVPVDGREHEMTLYMEDTMWPYEDKFEEYIVRCGEVYARESRGAILDADDARRHSSPPSAAMCVVR